ncbi:MAG: hypothetical protein JXA21_10120 [Anaerolineae bacterium]|nr:hypothetical protein [Anaerolineae bacterium]
MTRKAAFTIEEWITLRAALDATLYGTAEIDKKIYDAEAQVARRLEQYALPFVQELLVRGENPAEDDAVTSKAAVTPLDSLCVEALAILQTKASREEIAALGRTLRALALAVAEADDSVDARERWFISQLDRLLQSWSE